MNQCVILAGGLGTRMRSITDRVPKNLIEIHGKPFVFYQLDWLSRYGITDVVFCIGHKGEMIRDYVETGDAWGLNIQYVDEGDELRGTGGALRLAYDSAVLADAFFVMYGDSFLPIDYREIGEFFSTRSESAVMTVLKNQNQWDTSNVEFDSERRRVNLYEKNSARSQQMQYIDYGLSGFSRSVMGRLPKGQKVDLGFLFHKLSLEGELAGYEVRQRFYEIGSPTGLEDFRNYLDSN